MMAKDNSIYTTADEACFIDGLGRHSEEGKRIGPLAALMAYISAAEKRTNWRSIDGQAAIDYAKSCARELRRGTTQTVGVGKSFFREAKAK